MSLKQVFKPGVLLCMAALFMSAAPSKAVATPSERGVYDVVCYGALGDGQTVNTAAIQKAVEACAAGGGGEVLIPPGRFVTGTIYLKNHVHLRVAQGATLLGSTQLSDYPITHCRYPSRSDRYTVRALIWGEGLEDVGITGAGTIDGQGAHFRDNVATPEQVAAASELHVREGRYPLHEKYLNRPYLIRLISCRNVLVEGLSLRDSAMWMQQYLDCDFVTLRGLNVYNHVAANNDMIDLDGCRNVVVSDCVGDTDDDALTLKSTGNRATEHVVITNCILRSHCNAIKMGTESAGGFKDIAVSNCVIQRSQATKGHRSGELQGLAGVALEIVDGGTLERVAVSNLVIEGTTAPIFMRLGNRACPAKPGDVLPPVGFFRNVTVSNVVATGASKIGCAIAGLPNHCIENVTLENIRVVYTGGGTEEQAAAAVPEVETKYPESTMFGALPAYGFYFRHVRGLQVSGMELRCETPDARPALVADDVRNLRLEALNAPGEAPTSVVLKDSRDALLTSCVAAPSEALVRLAGECADIRLLNNDLSKAEYPYLYAASGLASSVLAKGNLPAKHRRAKQAPASAGK